MPDNYSWYYDQIKDAALQLVEDGKSVKTFLLRKYQDRSNMSTWLFFTPVGIIISGDIRPAGSGVIALGYGLDWFAQKLDAGYLAEKFLKEKWLPEQALQSWKECLKTWEEKYHEFQKEAEGEEDGTFIPYDDLLKKMNWRYGIEPTKELEGVTIVEVLREFVKNTYYFEDGRLLYESLPAYFDEDSHCYHRPFSSEDLGGHGYAVAEVGWLYAIQRRFYECYSKIIESR